MKNMVSAAVGVVVLLMTRILRFATAWQTSPSESKVYSVDFKQHRHRPLAFLRADSSGRNLEIFAEDPTWPHKVRRARLRCWCTWVQNKRVDPGRGSRGYTPSFGTNCRGCNVDYVRLFVCTRLQYGMQMGDEKTTMGPFGWAPNHEGEDMECKTREISNDRGGGRRHMRRVALRGMGSKYRYRDAVIGGGGVDGGMCSFDIRVL